MSFLRKRKTKKVFSWLLVVFLLITFVFFVIPLLPLENNYSLKVVLSGSMEPAIKKGSLVTVIPAEDYKKGDVITFVLEDKAIPTTHRIYDSKVIGGELVYITKGDANESIDYKNISKENIEGKVLFSLSYLGYAVDFAKRPIGFALLVFIPAGIIIYDQGRNIFKELKKKNETPQ